MRNGIIRPEILNHREKKVLTETPDKPINEESPLEMKNQFKTFGNLCVSCQYLLFIDNSCSTKSSWASYFKKENNMIVINFNYPLEENQVVETIEYPFRLKVDLRQGLMDFKNILEKYVSEIDHEKYKPKEIKDDKAEETKKEIEKENVPMDDITNETYMKLVEHQKCLKVSNTKNLIMKKGGKSWKDTSRDSLLLQNGGDTYIRKKNFSFAIITDLTSQWPVPSRPLVNPPEERLPANNWPPRLPVRAPRPPVESRSPTGTVPVQWLSVRSGVTRNPLSS